MNVDTASDYPTVKIRPGKGRRLRSGAPWVFADEIAMDRRTRALPAGTVAHLVDGDGPLGVVAFNAQSKIAARLLDRDPGAKIDQGWLVARLTTALRLRERLFDAPFYRLIHAEGDGMPGVVVDRFANAVVIQPNAAWADVRIEMLAAAVTQVTGCDTVVVNAMSRARRHEGLGDGVTLQCGALSGAIPVAMNGATYFADLQGGQKTGLFFDQRPNHAFVRSIAAGANVLDVFCHVGGFGLAALSGGAARVIAVDSSAPALDLARRGAEAMGAQARFETIRDDAFDALRTLDGSQFDVVVCDPPAFAPTRGALDAGLRAYARLARMAAARVAPGGVLVLCSCSHAVDVEAFYKASRDGIARAGRRGALIYSGRAGPDHPVHPGLPETAYLKAMAFHIADLP